MSNLNKSTAFPTSAGHTGMSKLEFAAIEIAKAISSRQGNSWTPEEISVFAVRVAIQLFKETAKE